MSHTDPQTATHACNKRLPSPWANPVAFYKTPVHTDQYHSVDCMEKMIDQNTLPMAPPYRIPADLSNLIQ